MLKAVSKCRERAERHFENQEYFDCITVGHKCSTILGLRDKPLSSSSLVLNPGNPTALLTLIDCYLYSSIAYLQLREFN